MAGLYSALQLIVAIAFGLVGLAAVADWARFRGRGRAALALALGSLGAVSLAGQVTMHFPATTTVLTFFTIPLFLASGYGLMLFRNELRPYPRWVFIAANVLIGVTAVAFLVAAVLAGPQKPGAKPNTALLLTAFLLIIVWAVSVGEPAVSLAIASRGRPAVQRARIRSLSLAYGAILLILAIDIVVGSIVGFNAKPNPTLQVATELVALASAPLMYFSFSPPVFLRQIWRAREEEPLRRAMHDLLLATQDRAVLAEKALGWAMRLVGADAGLITDADAVLAATGLEPGRAENLRLAGARLEGSGPIDAFGPGSAYRVPLSLADGTGSVVMVSGPFTPLFGADEYGRMDLYAVSLAAAMDRATLVATLERRVAERTADLEASNSELEAFSYTVSHDLRQPLRAIDGFSRALGESVQGKLDEQSQHYLASITRNAQHMGQLIDALLGFSRLTRQPIQRKRISPGAIAKHVADGLQQHMNGQAPTISVADLPTCSADATLLEQVFANLIGNAVKFSAKAEHPTVEVGWQKGERGIPVYYVRDNGAGFDMKYADKLFGVFQRLHSTRDYEGTGAGLAIVQRIVHRHGGRIWAEGAVGKGATFYFTLRGETADVA